VPGDLACYPAHGLERTEEQISSAIRHSPDYGPIDGPDLDVSDIPPPSPPLVYLGCDKEQVKGMWVPENSVTFLDISEDESGRDVMTFICPNCGEKHKSLRLG